MHWRKKRPETGLFCLILWLVIICLMSSCLASICLADQSCIIPPHSKARTVKGIAIYNFTSFPIDKRAFDQLFELVEDRIGVSHTHLLPGWSLTICIYKPVLDFKTVPGTGRAEVYIPWPGEDRETVRGYYISGRHIIHMPLPIGNHSSILHELTHHILEMWGLPDDIDFSGADSDK